MPLRSDIKKVLVIGSGPIIIGQAAEFDYAGTQACRALKQEGLEVVLINSNPATIMTDKAMADKVYIEPLTQDVVKRIIQIEKPDSLLSTMACKSAIKAGMHTDPAELRRLVDRVQSGEIQYCPHGRPVAVKLSKYQVEKMFKRA